MSEKNNPPTAEKGTPKKGKPSQVLPTWRISFGKQLEILRAYAAVCGDAPKVVTNQEVGKIVGLRPDSVSLTNGFFAAIDLLQRSEGGYTPCREVLAFNNAHDWAPENAGHRLAPVVGEAWFAKALIPQLRFRQLLEKDAIIALAEAASAGPEYEPQLQLLLDYLAVAGIIARENGSIRLAKALAPEEAAGPSQGGADATPPPTDKKPPEDSPGRLSTSFTKGNQGAISLNINIQVDMNEMARWTPDRITAFLGGLAQVLAAKGQTEKGECKA